jgi:hypothetical protein
MLIGIEHRRKASFYTCPSNDIELAREEYVLEYSVSHKKYLTLANSVL